MNDGGRKVLVTGASGFVGRHVVPVLARSGWQVRRAVRTPPRDANDVTIGSLSPTTDWRAALDGVDAVVHLAARVHQQSDEQAIELYRNVNIEGTLNLAPRAFAISSSSARSWCMDAATTGVRRFEKTICLLPVASTATRRRPQRSA